MSPHVPANAIPVLAALGPGVAAGLVLLARRFVTTRRTERAVRRAFEARMTIQVHARRNAARSGRQQSRVPADAQTRVEGAA